MSKTIRQGPNVTWIDGTSQLPATRVHVRWQWIALPLTLTVFSIVLLGVAIERSEGAGKVIWKSSILATLFHGVQGWDAKELDHRSLSEMEKAAKGMNVALTSGTDGALLLCRVGSSTVPGGQMP